MLRFMHITKTGGTAIEVSAREKNILWGRFDNVIIGNIYELTNIEHASIKYLKDKELYNELNNKYDWFVVIRNPYERIVSLINYYKTYEPYLYLEREISDLLTFILNNDDFTTLPSSDYVFDGERKIVKHVLYYENLEEEFNNLMKLYNLDIPLINNGIHVSNKYVSKHDLTPEFIEKINIKYANDFKNFGYQMVNKFN